MLASIVFEGWSWWWEGINQKHQLARAVVTLSVVTVAIFWCIWMFKISRKGTVPPLPPGPRGLPLVGYLPFLSTDLHRSFAKLAHVYGPIMKLRLGKKLVVIMSSPSLAKEVLRDQDTTFANRDPTIGALTVSYGGLDVAWSPYGPHWRMLRRCLHEMLNPRSLEACYALRRHEVRKAIRGIYNNKIGTAVNISELMFLTVFELVMNIMWGGGSQEGEESGLRVEFQEVAGEVNQLMGEANISDFFPILASFDLQGVEQRSKKLLLWLDRFFDPIIDQRLKGEPTANNNNDGNKDFLQFLLELKEKEHTESFKTRTEVKALLMVNFFSNHLQSIVPDRPTLRMLILIPLLA
ncbi:hypothetical protein HHK36_005167 [Tetracentron sinense]|uniref:Cytochrome P450 n=1 Tax=Tetracentron sinense TaxID=13715 RepID=A0A834ZMP2_TETSI|nr:hypothetical protein HHK36_005165 [Tetracentron sinense]KAF8409094.1 hypothetical protein HHK36_005167 [Tetracentron sinense]